MEAVIEKVETLPVEVRQSSGDLLTQFAERWQTVMCNPALVAEDCEPDKAIDLLMAMETLKTRTGELVKWIGHVWDEFGLEMVKRHGKDAMYPYYSGKDRNVKCRDTLGAFRHLLETLSVEDAEECLSSSALKQSVFKDKCGEAIWAKFFEVKEAPALKESEGKKADAFKLMKANQFALK